MVRRAACVILYRAAESGDLEVYLVLRSTHLRFLGGHLAFPGGRVDDGDARLPLSRPPPEPDEHAFLACAGRELFEETGILVASPRPSSASPTSGSKADRDSLEDVRRKLLDERDDAESSAILGAFLATRGMSFDAGAFEPVARLVTPPFSRLRYDTMFYLVEMPAAASTAEPSVIPGELVSGGWYKPSSALKAWTLGEARIAPPVVTMLEELAAGTLAEASEKLRELPATFEGSGRVISVEPGYEVMPFTTPPLPERIPTNTFLVGCRRFIAVDPAPRPEVGRAHLFAAIDSRLARGDRLEAVVLTHHHPDHVGALEPTVARYGAPVWAHARAGELLSRTLERELRDGDVIELGEGPDDRPGWSLRCLLTPGHAEGHIALHDERHRSLIGGDLLSTLVSMYVGSPGGSLRDYFASLERIRSLDLETLHPAHGSLTHEPNELIDDTLKHRRKRIDEVRAALGETPRDVETVALEIYSDEDSRLRPLLVRATRAALEYLVEDGLAESVGEDRFRRR